MNIQLIDGEFLPQEALEILTQMISIKIKFHEGKISKNEVEEDVKAREAKIKRLQKDLYELRKAITSGENSVHISAQISIG
ncbi:MAG: hypothetical protein SGJ00_05590 [bacterium]|nr:hypothetical protein [bacterium]